MNIVDNYMVSVESADLDQTPVKVLERLDNLSTFDEDSEPELLWDDCIEHNAQHIVDEICQNMSTDKSKRMESTSQNNQSAVSSIINVNLDDYFRVINHPVFHNDSKEDQIQIHNKTSTPCRTDDSAQNQTQNKSSTKCVKDDSAMDKYVATADDYLSFNISLSDSNEDICEDDLETIIKDQGSRTRSGKHYK